MSSNLTLLNEKIELDSTFVPLSEGHDITWANLTWLKETTMAQDSDSLPPTEEAILGAPVMWTFLVINAILGILGVLGNAFTVAAICCFYTLRENSTCRIVASLAIADCLSGLSPFLRIAR